MTNPGIDTQSAASILEDVDDFYFGGCLPWFHGTRISGTGAKVIVTLTDPDEDDGDDETAKDYELSARHIRNAFAKAEKQGYHLCCLDEIVNEQLGCGCAQDLDIILQTACYGELVFS